MNRSRSPARAVVRGEIGNVKKKRKELFANELGYRDESNPFGDNTLTQKFVWKKKNEYLQAAGLYRPSSKDQEVGKMQAKIREIQQVKKRRDEREVERQLLEQQRLEHDKELHDEEYGEWLTKEEKFHLDNAKARTQLRIEQGRERPLDLVAKALAIAEGEQFEDMTILDKPPHQLFNSMNLEEVEEIMDEVNTFVRIDSQEHKDFWQAMRYIATDAYEGKRSQKAGRSKAGSAISGLGPGVAEGVVEEIHQLLCSKSKPELGNMLVEINDNLKSSPSGMDTQFFEAVAAKIPLYVARAEVDHWHGRAKVKSDAWLAKKEAEAEEAEAARIKALKAQEWDDIPDGKPGGEEEGFSPELEPLEEEEAGGIYSPVLEPLSKYQDDQLLDPEEDLRVLRQVRNTIIEAFGGTVASAAAPGLDRSRDDALFNAELAKGMASGETAFNAEGRGPEGEFHGEVLLDKKRYEWEDKYKPRKPRFFNRVKTGYEWNKYNQTHYDHDNPPPKIVQGYKFNIFYPDLIDKSKAPTYHVEKSDTADTVLLRFHAGPPYEDVAFKIVNREWNISHKFGFRVVFDRGVLQLYFNVKRWRYRR